MDLKMICSKKGSSIVDVLIFAGIMVFVLLPLFSFGIEKFLIQERAAQIRDAVDSSAVSTYYAISAESLSKADADMDLDNARNIFQELLAQNLKLSNDLQPLVGSIAEARVVVRNFDIYCNGFPQTCTVGNIITRPTVHCIVIVPIKPAMFRKMILDLFAREFVELEIHLDSEIPIDR